MMLLVTLLLSGISHSWSICHRQLMTLAEEQHRVVYSNHIHEVSHNVKGIDCIYNCWHLGEHILQAAYSEHLEECSCLDAILTNSQLGSQAVYVVDFRRPGESFIIISTL